MARRKRKGRKLQAEAPAASDVARPSATAESDKADARPRGASQPAPAGSAVTALEPALLVVLLGFLTAYVLVAQQVLHAFPNSGDEYSYLIQAELFASGRLSAPSLPAEIAPAFTMDHVIDDGSIRSKYPPGWPALLALGELLGAPFLVNPMLACMTLWLVHAIARTLAGVVAGWCALFFLGLCPMFVVMAGSFYSHVPSLCLLAAYGLLLLRALRGGTAVRLAWMGAGAALGMAFLVRPFEALAFALGAVALLPRRPRELALVALGGAPFVVVFLAYNDVQFGSPLRTGYEAYRPTFMKLYDVVGPEVSLSNILEIDTHARWFFVLAQWVVPGALLLLPLGALVAWRRNTDDGVLGRHLVLSLGAQLLALQLTYPATDVHYGPRYLFALLLPAAVLVGLGADLAHRRLGPSARPALLVGAGLSLAGAVLLNQQQLRFNAHDVGLRRDPYVRAREQGIERAVVFLADTPHFPPSWYVRNGPDFETGVIYAIRGSGARNRAVMEHFDRERAFRYEPPRGDGPGRLVEVRYAPPHSR